MPLIRVVYKGKEYDFDYVASCLLGTLITGDKITHFYRPSEERWVNIRIDPGRVGGGGDQGPKRRSTDPKPNPNQEKGGFIGGGMVHFGSKAYGGLSRVLNPPAKLHDSATDLAGGIRTMLI